MSTHERELPQGAGIATLANPPKEASLEADKSLVRYLWNPFIDIKLATSDGLWIRLGKGYSYYGQGKPGETQIEYDERRGDSLVRCIAYPCWNIQYLETLHNLGKFTPEQQAAGNALGAPAGQEEVTIYAGVCAADMVSQYGIAARGDLGAERGSYGLRVLAPLTGMDGSELATAEELVKLVQPYGWKLTNLKQEERGLLEDEETLLFDLSDKGPAYERIQGSGLDNVLKPKAEALRRLMLSGVRDACTKARFDFAELIKNQTQAKLGKIGFKSMPSKYDERVCFLLGEPVPSAVARPVDNGTDPAVAKTLETLTNFVVNAGGAPQSNTAEEVAEMKTILSQMRAERTMLQKLKKELEEKGIQTPGE